MNYKKGPVPVLLNVYKKTAEEFVQFLSSITDDEYTVIVDSETEDKDCRSIQTIISHIVNSGYGYAHYIRGAIGVDSFRPEYKIIDKEEIDESIGGVINFTEKTFEGKDISYDKIDAKIVLTPWNDDLYSIESILEHAIVHILRHKIQIERYLKSLRN